MTDGAYLYILKCADGSYYAGTARATLEQRVAEHNAGHYDGYTASRRPVILIFSQSFERITDAIAADVRSRGGHAPRRKPSSGAISRDWCRSRGASAASLRPHLESG